MRYLLILSLITWSFLALSNDDGFFLKERNDPIVEKAFKTAQTNINVFLDAVNSRDSDDSKFDYYAAYLKFNEGGTVEYLWLADVQKYEDMYVGVIVSEPRLLTDTQHGETIGFHSFDIHDWQLIERGSGRVVGAFLACATSSDSYLNENKFNCN